MRKGSGDKAPGPQVAAGLQAAECRADRQKSAGRPSASGEGASGRHLKQLVEDGTLKKVSSGIYSYQKKASFGRVPAEDSTLVKAFLKSDDFLLVNPNAYNALGVGTTQLYNEQVVYNRKRHGKFTLDGRVFDFRVKPYFPKALSKEFLLVDLVNNVKYLAEDQMLVKIERFGFLRSPHKQTIEPPFTFQIRFSPMYSMFLQACS